MTGFAEFVDDPARDHAAARQRHVDLLFRLTVLSSSRVFPCFERPQLPERERDVAALRDHYRCRGPAGRSRSSQRPSSASVDTERGFAHVGGGGADDGAADGPSALERRHAPAQARRAGLLRRLDPGICIGTGIDDGGGGGGTLSEQKGPPRQQGGMTQGDRAKISFSTSSLSVPLRCCLGGYKKPSTRARRTLAGSSRRTPSAGRRLATAASRRRGQRPP